MVLRSVQQTYPQLVLGQHIQLVLEIEAGVRHTPALEKLSVKVDTDTQVVNAAWCDIGCG